tara:strand:+ start:1308 stop:2312 length:1005 start_codon:yes stop_codon:yes gene_type:complete
MNIKFFIAVIFSFLIIFIEPLKSGYRFGEEQKINSKKIREKLTIDDFRYPMLFNNDIYDFVTVAVFGTGAPGSGVIIAQKGVNYYVLTTNHVVGKILKGDEIGVQTLDGTYHTAQLLDFDEKIDGALIKFTSEKTYYKAFIHADVLPRTGMYILTEGYALASEEAKKASLRRSLGPIVTVIENNTDGYDLFYDAATNVGMSGGGVFSDFGQTKIKGKGWSKDWLPIIIGPNEETKDRFKKNGWKFSESQQKQKNKQTHPCYAFSTPILVGIHGKSESYKAGGKSGASMGISINSLLERFGNTLFKEGIIELPDENETLIWKDGCPIYHQVKKNF